MVALCFLVVEIEKENPDVRDAASRRGPGRVVDLFLAVNGCLPFFIQVRMDVGCSDPLQDFFEAIVYSPNSQSDWITNCRSTADSFYNCSFCLTRRARLCSR